VIAVLVLATLSILSAVCGGPRSPMDVGEPANFTDEGATQLSGYQGAEPKIEMEKRGGLWVATVFQGRQPSAGYAIRVERAIHVGTGVRVRARFTMPTSDAGAQGVPTSPAHAIGFVSGLPDAIYLYDQDDRKRAEWVRR
jgi:hypothetical protein